MDAYERPSCTNFCVRRKNKALRVFTSARGVNEDNWSSRWRFADYRLLATARAIRPARFHEEPSPGGGRFLGKHQTPYQPQVPRQAATRGPRGIFHNSPLMAGRRRRTAAAALLWRHFRCRYHSSNRSTCAEIELQAPRAHRRDVVPVTASVRWRGGHDGLRLLLRIT